MPRSDQSARVEPTPQSLAQPGRFHELDDDLLLRPAEAVRLLPRAHGEKSLHPSCISRWAQRGVSNRRTGEVIKLRTRRIGRRTLVRVRDLRDFMDAQAG